MDLFLWVHIATFGKNNPHEEQRFSSDSKPIRCTRIRI